MPKTVQSRTGMAQPSDFGGRRIWFALAGFALVEFLALQSEQAFAYNSGSEVGALGLARLTLILPAAATLVAALLIAPRKLRLVVLGLGLAVAAFHRALMQPETLYVDPYELLDRGLFELLLIGLVVPPLVRRALGPAPQFSKVRTIIFFAIVSAFGVAFCETVVVFAVHAQNTDVSALPAWRVWWRGALLGVVTIVPAAMLWHEWGLESFEGMALERWQELAVLVALFIPCHIVTWGTGATPVVNLVFALWAFYRFRPALSTTAVLLLVLAESALMARPPGASGLAQPPYAQLVVIQGLMITSVIGAHLIAVGLTDWRNAFGLLRDNQERLWMALKAARDGVYEWNLQTGEIHFEPVLSEVYGSGPTPKNMAEALPFMHPEDLQRWENYRVRLDNPGGTQEEEIRIKALSGEWFWFRVRGSAVEFDVEGRATRAVGVFEDITDIKADERALRESEQRSRTMAALSSEGICKLVCAEPIPIDLPEDQIIERFIEELRVEYCNEVNARMFGFESASAMVGARFSDFTPRGQLNYDHAQRFVRGGFGVAEGEVRNITSQGKELYSIVNVTGVVEDGALQCVWRFARDITARKQSELRLEEDNEKLRQIIASAREFEGIIGDSPQMQNVRLGIEKVAMTDFTALILGETGTGKELVAEAIHSRSRRKKGPFVKLNCATLTPSLIESELFGHEKGAFTGAATSKLGRFELADGGTILLDEIGELPPELQAKLLRVLQEGEFERVGGTRTHRVDVRVLAATNRDLKAAVESGSFREDLYYRLHVFPLRLPPLRERGNDVMALAEHFLEETSRKLGRTLTGFSDRSRRLMSAYHWPGNVRELQHAVERAAILSPGRVVEVDDIYLQSAAEDVAPLRTLAEAERGHIREVLERTGWVVEGPEGAAAILGLAPSTLRNRMAKLGLKRPKDRASSAGSGPAS